MYKITEDFSKIVKKYRTKYYKDVLGLNYAFVSSILNGNKNCSEIIAKGILSICFEISLSDEKIPKLLEKYFIKTKE
mgnify:CR=1 FL=1